MSSRAAALAATDASIAELVPVVALPVSPFGYGSDLSCTDDLDETFSELGGDDPLLVAQAAFRRITTPRGTLPDDLDYGVDARLYLSRGLEPGGEVEISGQMRSELLKDDRIAEVSVSLLSVLATRTIEIQITGTTSTEEPFRLTLELSSAGVLLRAISAGGTD